MESMAILESLYHEILEKSGREEMELGGLNWIIRRENNSFNDVHLMAVILKKDLNGWNSLPCNSNYLKQRNDEIWNDGL